MSNDARRDAMIAGDAAAPDAAATIEARLVELESRLAFQEHALLELSDALAASRSEGASNAELLRRALDELKPSRDGFFADAASEPPPPHY